MTDMVSVQVTSNVSLGCVNVGTHTDKIFVAVDDYRTCDYASVHMNLAEAKALAEGLQELIAQLESGDADKNNYIT